MPPDDNVIKNIVTTTLSHASSCFTGITVVFSGGRLVRQEKTTNVQDGEPKGGIDPKLHTPATTSVQHYTDKGNSGFQIDMGRSSKVQKGQTPYQQADVVQNQSEAVMAKYMGSLASTSGSKSKNKPSKKRRDVLNKKLENSVVIPKTFEASPGNNSTQGDGICKKFILVDEYTGLTIPHLKVQSNSPIGGGPTD